MENLTSAAKTTIIVVFAIYTLFQFFYSFLSRQAMKKGAGSGDFMSKFYTGGRSSGVLVTAMMVSAGVAGAGVFMGVPGYTYTFGAIWMVCCFFSLCTNFMVLGLIGKRVGIVARRTKSNTFVELFMNRYENSKVFGALSCLVVLFFLGAFAVSTITGGGRIFQILTGADYRIGLAIFTALVVVAALTGGVKGVASAIVIQGIVMTISVIVLFIMGVGATPGYTATIQELMQTNTDWFVPKGIGTAISFAFLWGYTTFTMPHVTMSTLTYKDTKTLHNAIKVGAIVVAAWLLCLNGLCFTVKYLFPEGSLATPDLGIPTLAVSVMPPWAAGLVLAGVCGAVQSSVGGMIVSLAGTLVGDLYKNIIDPKVDEDKLKKLNTAGIVVVALVVFLFACNPPAPAGLPDHLRHRRHDRGLLPHRAAGPVLEAGQQGGRHGGPDQRHRPLSGPGPGLQGGQRPGHRPVPGGEPGPHGHRPIHRDHGGGVPGYPQAALRPGVHLVRQGLPRAPRGVRQTESGRPKDPDGRFFPSKLYQ